MNNNDELTLLEKIECIETCLNSLKNYFNVPLENKILEYAKDVKDQVKQLIVKSVTLESLNDSNKNNLKLFKKYVKVLNDVDDHEMLVFKNISSEKNKKDFEKIKELLENE